jgi:hypothetical protein
VKLDQTMKEITQIELDRLGVVPGPRWEDCCSHDPQDYVATYKYEYRAGPPHARSDMLSETIDLYVIQCHGEPWQSICLRFGNDRPAYYSGPIQVLWELSHQPYLSAKAILLVLGQIRWHRKEAKEESA